MTDTWTNELIENLIDFYRVHRVLWDSSDVNYKNKNLKKDAWKAISDALGVHELEIQRKIKNLTTQFFREKKKINGNNKSGAAASDTTRWFLYKRLLFLFDKNEPSSQLKKRKHETHDIDQERRTDEETSQNQNSLRNEDPISVSKPSCSANTDIRKKLKVSKRKISHNQRQEEVYSIPKQIQGKKSRNRFDIFGELVAAKIEALKSSYAQNMVEHLISNILFEASIGKYDAPTARQMTPFSTHSSNSNSSEYARSQSPESLPSPKLEDPR